MATKSIALFTLLVACAPRYPKNTMSVHETIVIDTAFTAEQSEAIALAADDWQSATDGLTFTVYEAPCSTFKPTNATCVEPRHSADSHCGESFIGCWTSELIELDTWRMHSNEELRLVATHEIGHSLGLDHSKRGHAMAYRVDLQTPPTCDDIAAFWRQYEVRGSCKN